MQVARQNSFVLFNEMKAFHLNVEFLSLHILSCAIVQWMQYCNYFKTYLLNKMPSPEKLFIIQCNPFSLAGCVTSKKFRCQHNKENLRLVSAHILWGARPDSESIVRTFKCRELLSLNSWKTFWATEIYFRFLSIYSFSGGNTFYHLGWYKTEKNELKGNEVIRKKCGTIFGDIYKLLEANKNCYQLEQQRRVGWC